MDGILLTSYLRPLAAQRETGTTTATQVGIQHGLDDQLGSHLKQSLLQGSITAYSYGILDGLSVDMATVFQNQTGLTGVEGDLFLSGVYLAIFLVQQALYRLAAQDGGLVDLLAILRLYLQIQVVVGLDTNQGTHFTETVTATLVDGSVGLMADLYRHVVMTCDHLF